MLMTATHREPIVLDTTVRDGSYAVNFQYTDDDVRRIVGDLDAAGIPYIEIGHGVTIGAAAAQGPAAHTDEEYFRAARSVVRNARLGAVIVPALAASRRSIWPETIWTFCAYVSSPPNLSW